MLKHLKIFQTTRVDNILVVCPQGDPSAFRYNDLHREANSVRDLLMGPDIQHLVLNLQNMQYFGSEFIGSMVSMAREVKNRQGRAVICEANPQMLEVLENMSLFKLWPYFSTQQEALAELQPSGDETSP